MRILITNDDGITAPGLAAAEDIAAALEPSEIWVVAPAFEQSAVAHAISYVRPMRLEPLAERRYAVEGTPADCILVALTQLMAGAPPDLVLSGVNRGHNVADDVVYSGTVAGAREASLRSMRAIALSQYMGPGNGALDDPFEAARARGPGIVRALLDRAPWADAPYPVFYNVNFPARPAAEVAGVRATAQGKRPVPSFTCAPYTAPNRRQYFWLTHTAEAPQDGNAGCAPGEDARETSQGWVSVSPLRARMAADDVAEALAHALDDL